MTQFPADGQLLHLRRNSSMAKRNMWSRKFWTAGCSDVVFSTLLNGKATELKETPGSTQSTSIMPRKRLQNSTDETRPPHVVSEPWLSVPFLSARSPSRPKHRVDAF